MLHTLPSFETVVKPEWIDYNGHMNVAYYVLAFDLATDELYEALGIGLEYKNGGQTLFTLGMNVDYLRELMEGDPIRIETQLIDMDHKRIHYFHQMVHAREGYLAATNECLCMNVDLESRKSAPFPTAIMQTLTDLHQTHQNLPLPPQAFRKLGIRKAA
ncbi:MAG: thioesterase family protein [Chloroflexota bacterium]